MLLAKLGALRFWIRKFLRVTMAVALNQGYLYRYINFYCREISKFESKLEKNSILLQLILPKNNKTFADLIFATINKILSERLT